MWVQVYLIDIFLTRLLVLWHLSGWDNLQQQALSFGQSWFRFFWHSDISFCRCSSAAFSIILPCIYKQYILHEMSFPSPSQTGPTLENLVISRFKVEFCAERKTWVKSRPDLFHPAGHKNYRLKTPNLTVPLSFLLVHSLVTPTIASPRLHLTRHLIFHIKCLVLSECAGCLRMQRS